MAEVDASRRRAVHYDTFEDLRRDARALAAGDVIMAGNWSLGQIFQHLAAAFDSSIDGSDFRLPVPAQWVIRVLMKRRLLGKTLPRGHRIPKKLRATMLPGEIEDAEGLAHLEAAIERIQRAQHVAPHPLLGRLTRDEWHQFHLRHAELHMSFALPVQPPRTP